MQQHLNYRMRIVLQDGRIFIGHMMAFDKHMNLVLSDCEEYRRVRVKAKASTDGNEGTKSFVEQEQRRALGLVVLRGENVISLTVEGGPPPRDDNKLRMPASSLMPGAGAGTVRAAARGVPVAVPGSAPLGLAAPVSGIGAAAIAPPALIHPPVHGMVPPPPPAGFAMPPPPAGFPMMPPPPMGAPGFIPPPAGFPMMPPPPPRH